jgi:hypothetical protein
MNAWIKMGAAAVLIAVVCCTLSLVTLVVTIGSCPFVGFHACMETGNSRYPIFGLALPISAIVLSQVGLALRRKGKKLLAETQP